MARQIVEPQLLKLALDGKMPNSELPVVVYRSAVEGEDLEGVFRRVFTHNGWGGLWTDGIFGYHHFHSNAHEVLGIIEDTATLVLGGDAGAKIDVSRGDVLVLPAGTGHRRLKAGPDFLVVGAYPKGQERFDIYVDSAMCANYRSRLRAVELPSAATLYGKSGPLVALWAERRIPVERQPILIEPE